jgi:membrane-associated protease RseP (regulator of RpoE activity)
MSMLRLTQTQTLAILRDSPSSTISFLVQQLTPAQWFALQAQHPMRMLSSAGKLQSVRVPFGACFTVDELNSSAIFVDSVTPEAAAVGLAAGDLILEANGAGYTMLSPPDAKQRLASEHGPVDLVVLRPSGPDSAQQRAGLVLTGTDDLPLLPTSGVLMNFRIVRDGALGMNVIGGSNTKMCGLFVARTIADSPAARAGLAPGDRIVEINGRGMLLGTESSCLTLLRSATAVVDVLIQRTDPEDWAAIAARFKLEAPPKAEAPASSPVVAKSPSPAPSAVTRDPETPSTRAAEHTVASPAPTASSRVVVQRVDGSLGLAIVGRTARGRLGSIRSPGGVFVSSTSPAVAAAGLQPGHRIVAVDGHDVSHRSYEDVLALLSAAGERVVLDIAWSPDEYARVLQACEDETTQDTPVCPPPAFNRMPYLLFLHSLLLFLSLSLPLSLTLAGSQDAAQQCHPPAWRQHPRKLH